MLNIHPIHSKIFQSKLFAQKKAYINKQIKFITQPEKRQIIHSE